jgi:ATP-binding cassette, subfamily C (CFTR/MRP), member 4
MAATGAFILFSMARSLIFSLLVLTATTNMHTKMAWKVLRSKIQFFDSNPIGRVTSRFSKDMLLLDHVFAGITIFVTQGIMRSITVAITVCITNPFLLIIVSIGICQMIWVLKVSTRAMSDAQKLE